MIGSFLLKSVLFRALIFCLCCLYLPFACKQSFKLPSSLSYLSYRADWETENALPKHVFERPFTYANDSVDRLFGSNALACFR